MVEFVYPSLVIALYAAITVVLVRAYLRTRNAAFLWLAAAVVAWPLASSLLVIPWQELVNRAARGNPAGFFPFTLVAHGQITLFELVVAAVITRRLVGIGLLLVAVVYLSRTIGGQGRAAS